MHGENQSKNRKYRVVSGSKQIKTGLFAATQARSLRDFRLILRRFLTILSGSSRLGGRPASRRAALATDAFEAEISVAVATPTSGGARPFTGWSGTWARGS